VDTVFFAALGLAVAGCALVFACRLPLAATFAWWLRGCVGMENNRLIMPGVGVTAMLVTLGWLTLAPAHIQRGAAMGGAAALLMLAVAALFVTIRPAYVLSLRLTAATAL
jgi:hypothetical protein